MKILNTFLLISTVVLVACSHDKKHIALNSEPMAQPPLPPHAPLDPLPATRSKDLKMPKYQPLGTQPAIIIPDQAPLNPSTEWQPKEGDLVRAGELVMKLKQSKGSDPSIKEMISYLQENMAVSLSQAHLILEGLGLE